LNENIKEEFFKNEDIVQAVVILIGDLLKKGLK